MMPGSWGILYEQCTKQTRLKEAENLPHLSNMMEEERDGHPDQCFFRKLRYILVLSSRGLQ